MSHQFESGMFVAQKAWHGLGTVVDKAPTTAEAIRIAGMDWQVTEEPLFTPDAPVDGWKCLRRSDNGGILHVCRETWTPLQNSEAFEFFDPIIQDGDVELEAAISLQEGKRIAITAKIRDGIADVLPGDPVEQYLVLYNAHDGSLCLGVMFSNVRVVCANTLAAAISDRKRGGGVGKFIGSNEMAIGNKAIKLRHTKNIQTNLNTVRDSINVARRQFTLTLEQYRAMASTPMGDDLFTEFLSQVFERRLKQGDNAEALRAYEPIKAKFQAGVGIDIPGVRGTVWAGYQAVTEYVTHERGWGDDVEAARTRLNQVWFGEGHNIIQRAHDKAVALCR